MADIPPLELIVDVSNPDRAGALRSFDSRGLLSSVSFVRGNNAPLYLRLVTPDPSGAAPFVDFDTTGCSISVGLGEPNGQPQTGLWGFTGSDPLPFDADAVDLQAALGKMGLSVKVTSFTEGAFTIEYVNAGAQTLLTVGDNTLLPASSITIDRVITGDSGVKEVLIVRLATLPLALNSTWTDATPLAGLLGVLQLNTYSLAQRFMETSDSSLLLTLEVLVTKDSELISVLQLPARVNRDILDYTNLVPVILPTSYYTKTQVDSLITGLSSVYQPLEDQRLSKGDGVEFNYLTVQTYYGLMSDYFDNLTLGMWTFPASGISALSFTGDGSPLTFPDDTNLVSALTGQFQPPMRAGLDYLTPSGDGSLLTGIVAASGWPTALSGFTNDVPFLVNLGTGTGAVATGGSAVASGYYGAAFGSSTTSTGHGSAVFGTNATVSSDYAAAFGWGLTNVTDNSVEIGQSDTAKLQISAAGFNFIGAGITLNDVVPWQTPLVVGVDYLSPTGDGSGLTGITTAWAGITGTQSDVSLAGFTNNLDLSGASVNYASSSGSASVAASGWPTNLSSYTNDTGFTVNAGTGVDSLALGVSATATGDYSISLGVASSASGIASVAFGLSATASGDHSEAFGCSLTNSTGYSLEIGYTDSYKLQISSVGFNFIGPAITLNSATPWQTPLTAGTDYVTPTGDGSGLTGVVATSGWPTVLSGYSNDVGFLTSADMSSQSVANANTAGSAGQSTIVYGAFGDTLENTSGSQWTMGGDLQVGYGGIGCEFLSPVYFGLRSNPYRVDASGNASLYTLDIATGQVTIDTGGNYNSTYGSVTASHFYGDGGGLTGVVVTTAPSVTGTTGTAVFVIDSVPYYPHVTAGVLTFTDTP